MRVLNSSFRPTLVGSEVVLSPELADNDTEFQTNPRGVGGTPATRSTPTPKRFRPTLVGSEDWFKWRIQTRLDRFRPTLVGSEVSVGSTIDQPRRSFRPTLVGSEAR